MNIEENLEKKVQVYARPNGPIIIDGDFTFEDEDGNIVKQKRMSLCRCGASRKMPHCDGSHNRVNFKS
ncbi:MAG: CDGSH iron-sulfur domain-containing protein [Chitinophagales bacterium]